MKLVIQLLLLHHTYALPVEDLPVCTDRMQENCKENSCLNDNACAPALKCKNHICIASSCENFGDSICPDGGFRCIDGECVQQDFQCNRFENQCFNSSLVCVGTICIFDANSTTWKNESGMNITRSTSMWTVLFMILIPLVLIAVGLKFIRLVGNLEVINSRSMQELETPRATMQDLLTRFSRPSTDPEFMDPPPPYFE